MKTRIVLLVTVAALLLSNQTMWGQLYFGLRTGVDIETRSELGQLWDNDEISTGFLMGGTMEYKLNETLSLQTELNFIQKGEKYSSTINGVDTDIRKEFNYLTIPLLVRGTFDDELQLKNNWNVYGYAGPYYGYLVSAKNHVNTVGSEENTDITDDSVKDDWGVVLGGGVSYKLKNGWGLFSELRYDMGLGKIDNDNSDLRNKAISLCVGIRF